MNKGECQSQPGGKEIDGSYCQYESKPGPNRIQAALPELRYGAAVLFGECIRLLRFAVASIIEIDGSIASD